MPNALEQHLAALGAEELSNAHANNGCNDLVLPDSPELRAMHLEYNAWNLGIPVEQLNHSDDQFQPYPPVRHDGTVCVSDSLIEFAVRKLAGLITKPLHV